MNENLKMNDLVILKERIRVGSSRYILKGSQGRIVSVGNPIMAVSLGNEIIAVEKSLLYKVSISKRPSTQLDILPATIPHIVRMLERGAIGREFIETNKWLRGTGKTTALINFAKEFDLLVVVSHSTIVEYLRKHHSYDKIYAQNQEIRGLDHKGCVVDEGVDIDILNEKKIYPITGFIYKGDM